MKLQVCFTENASEPACKELGLRYGLDKMVVTLPAFLTQGRVVQ